MTTQPQSLADHLAAAYEAPEGDEARAAFRVESPDAAEWAMRKLAKAEAELNDAAALMVTEQRRISEWFTAQRDRISHDAAFFESLLTDWMRRLCDAELAEVGGDWSKVRHKTRRLPSGEVNARQAPDSWAATDEPAFIAWAETALPELVRVKKSANIVNAKAELDAVSVKGGSGAIMVINPATGELVPGITVTPGEVHYSVKVEP